MRARRWVGAVKLGDPPSAQARAALEAESRAAEEALSRSRSGEVGRVRGRLRAMIEGPRFQWAITALITINAVTLGLETSTFAMIHAGWFITILDQVILGIFVLEIVLKMIAFGPVSFFRRGWNVFDFVIVGIALVPSAGALSVLRALRILRALRLVSIVPAMRKVVQALLTSIPGVSSIMMLMILVFYIFAVIATRLYGTAFPQWFGTIGESMYSLFQIMTLESWSMGIDRPVMETFPQAWLVFVPFILITSFAVLNLFIAVIVNAMQEEHVHELEEARDTIEQDIAEQTMKLTEEVKSQTASLNRKVDGQTDQLRAEIGTLRAEIKELKSLVAEKS